MSPRSPFSTISLLIVSALLFLTPLAHSGALSDPFGTPKSIVVLSGALLLLLASILEALSRDPGPRLRSTALYLAVAFLLCAGVAAALSPNHGLALRGLAEAASLAIVAWAAARCVREPRDAAWLMCSALAGAALVAAGTVVQVYHPGFSLALAGVSILPPSPAGATLGDPGLSAQFLILALPLGIGAAALTSGAARLLCGGALGLVVSALFLASRPEGWIVGAAVMVLLALTGGARALRSGNGWKSLVPDPSGEPVRAASVASTVLLVVLALSRAPGVAPAEHAVAPLGHVALLAPTTGDPQADRAAAVRGSLALMARHPLGVGLTFWRHAFLEIAWTGNASSPFDLGHQAIHAGNSFVELAAETGVPGGLLFAALVLLLLAQAGRTAFRDPGSWGTVGFVSLNVLLGAGLAACFGSPFQEATPALLFWTVVGTTLAGRLRGESLPIVSRVQAAVSQAPPAGPGRRPMAWAALALWTPLTIAACFAMADRLDAGRRTLAAQSLIASGDLRRAIEALEAGAIRRSPDHLPHVLLGDACLRNGADTRAVEAFTTALSRSPWFPAAYLGRAAAWEDLGRYDLADADLVAALAVWPDAPEILLRRARLDQHRGRLEAALEDYRKVTRASPKSADPWCGMAELYLRMTRYDAALECFMTCIDRNPAFPRVNLGLGEAYEKKGLDEMALRYYKRAATSEERSVEPRLRLANLYDLKGQHCDAKDSLMAARDLEGDPQRRSLILELIDKVEPLCSMEQKQKK